MYFAGDRKGDVVSNQLWADNPSYADVLLSNLVGQWTAWLYRSATLSRKVSGRYVEADLVAGFRICTRGAPAYRVQPDESVWAAGLHRWGAADYGCFTSIGAVLNQTNSTLTLAN